MRDLLKRILLFFAVLSISFSLSAAEVSFHASSVSSLSYNDESHIPDSDGFFTLTLSDASSATITSEDGKEINVTFINTDEALIKWNMTSEEDIKLRYSLNDSKHKTLRKGTAELTLNNLPMNELTLFTLEAKYGKGDWYECGIAGIIPVTYSVPEEAPLPVELPELKGESEIRYVEPELVPLVPPEKKISIRLTASPYSIGIFDFINGHNIPDARYLTVTNYGLSADGELGYQANSNILFYAGAGYGYQMKRETIIPDAFRVSYIKAYTGLDLRFLRTGRFSSSLGVFAGGMMGINAGMYNISSILGGRLRFDYHLNSHLSIGLQTRFTASYLPADDPMYKSMTYLIDPVTLSLDVRL
ncbi:MAG: hypothetical protein ACI4NM_11080 [Bullifex sp.]